MIQRIDEHSGIIESVRNFDFNCFKASETIGRKYAFSALVFSMMVGLPKKETDLVEINNDKLVKFLGEI